MPFRFRVTGLHDLPTVGKVVLDGFFVSGSALTGQLARVSDTGNVASFTIEGIVLSGSGKPSSNQVSLTVRRKVALEAGIRVGLDVEDAELTLP